MEKDPNIFAVLPYNLFQDGFMCIKRVACQQMYIDPKTQLKYQCNLSKDHSGQCCCKLDGVEIYFNG